MPATAHLSYWHETAGEQARHYAPLEEDIDVDVAILGGGITGLTAAVHLKAAGRRVAVLEASQIGSGTTGFTSGHLDATTDLPLSRMVFDFGQAAAAAVATANREAIDQIEARCRQWPDCEFRRIPSFQFTESVSGLDGLQRQCTAARKLGYNCWFTRQVPLPFPCVGAIETAGQGRFHPQQYLQRLAAEVHGEGSAVYENTAASPPADGSPCEVQAAGARVRAKEVFVATHSPFLGISQLEFRVFPYQSYVIAARVDDPVQDALYWDDADPYHYIRVASAAEPDLLIIGGADHKSGQPLDERERLADVERYAEEHFSVRAIEHRWSAQFYVPADGLPHVGRVPGNEHVFIATGYEGTGLTWGTVAGTLVARMILGQRHPLDEVLSPGRLTLMASAKDVIAENLDVMRRFAVDRFAGERIADDEVPAGTGRLISRNGRLVAVYRDPSGSLFRLSPVCTHAGCIVHWNEAERTWDCPCHGGRYTAEGRRFYGPPVNDLQADREANGSAAGRRSGRESGEA
jgi:glycine/D-amino acid oxidase-like deaminating enzyme/nitrite reductase/ring-hydroxylating ferredoxin subunit